MSASPTKEFMTPQEKSADAQARQLAKKREKEMKAKIKRQEEEQVRREAAATIIQAQARRCRVKRQMITMHKDQLDQRR